MKTIHGIMIRRMFQRSIVLLAVVLLTVPAETEELTRRDRFELWNNCEPMNLLVEGLDDAAADIGLTKEAITVAARSRLRSARLYDADKPQYLYVQVSVVGRAFSIDLEYNKIVYEPATEIIARATTWQFGSTGTHGKNSGFILSDVSRHLDKFIDEYLRVNKDSCSAK